MSCPIPDATIHQGALAPYAFVYEATSADATFDLETITSATFRVLRESGAEDVWEAVVSDETETTATLTHEFEEGDLLDVEHVRITPELETPTGTFVAPTKVLRVVPRSQL